MRPQKRETQERLIEELSELRREVAQLRALNKATQNKSSDESPEKPAKNRLFKLIVGSMKEQVYVYSSKHVIEYMNPAMIRAIGHDATGELCHRAIYNFDDVCPWCQKEKALVNGPQQFETSGRSNGRHFIVSNIPLERIDGSTSILAITRDITDEKRSVKERLELEKRVHHTQRLESLRVLAGGIAHDFNNLLMGVLGNTDLALMDLPPDSPIRSYLYDIETAGKRAAVLSKQMLAYSGKGHFVVKEMNLSSLVTDMVDILEMTVSTEARLEIHTATDLPAIEADSTQLRQLILALVTNSLEATDNTENVISVTTGSMMCDKEYIKGAGSIHDLPEGVYSYIEISDTGSGITKEALPKIFDPFFSTRFTGRGLGLAATLGIVRGHLGMIKVHSEHGVGTRMKILFPAIEGQVVALTHPVAAIESSSDQKSILLVDDEGIVRDVGRRMLQRLGYDVVTVSTGRGAIRLFKHNPQRYSAVILDMTMPGMEGDHSFNELRRINRNTPVILSSDLDENSYSSSDFSGPVGFIQKPYQFERLRDKLTDIEAMEEETERRNQSRS